MKPTVTILLCFSTISSFAQAPKIQWEKSLGGGGNDRATCIRQTPDHGFIVGGWSVSLDGDVTGNHGSADCWVVKLDSVGNIQWENSYGGSNADILTCIRATSDGGYIFLARSFSGDGEVTDHHGSTLYSDVWVVKIDSVGKIQWERSYGGTSGEDAFDILQTLDGGYIVCADAWSSDGDVTGHHGLDHNDDYWIIKLDVNGNIEWNNCYGGSLTDIPSAILQGPDGGYFVAGYSTSNDGDVTGHHYTSKYTDIWIIKLNASGKLVGEKSLPNWDNQQPDGICFASDGGYIISGLCGSYSHYGIKQHGDYDLMLMKLTKGGKIDTACAMGGSRSENAFSVSPTRDGGYIVAGQTYSNDGDVTGQHGYVDYWVVKVDSRLQMQWEEALGGDFADEAYSVQQTSDGGYIVAGYAQYNSGQVTGNHWSVDYWIVKLAPDNAAAAVASIAPSNASDKNLLIYPNPSNNQVTVSFLFSNNIVSISDLLGRELKQWKMESGKLKMVDVSFLQQGVYVMEIKDEKGILLASEKLFKQ